MATASTRKTAAKSKPKTEAKPAEPVAAKPRKQRESKFAALDGRIIAVTADPKIDTPEKLIEALGKSAQGQPVRWRLMLLTKREQLPASFWSPNRKPGKKPA